MVSFAASINCSIISFAKVVSYLQTSIAYPSWSNVILLSGISKFKYPFVNLFSFNILANSSISLKSAI